MDTIPLDFSDKVVQNLHFHGHSLDIASLAHALRQSAWSYSILRHDNFQHFVLSIEKDENAPEMWYCEFIESRSRRRLTFKEFARLPRHTVKVSNIRILENVFDEYSLDFFDEDFREPIVGCQVPTDTVFASLLPYLARQGHFNCLVISGLGRNTAERVTVALRKCAIRRLTINVDSFSPELTSFADAKVDSGSLEELFLGGMPSPPEHWVKFMQKMT